MNHTQWNDEALPELQHKSQAEFAGAFKSILFNLKTINEELRPFVDGNGASYPSWEQPLTYPCHLTRTVASDDAPRIVNLILLRSSFGSYQERRAFINNMRKQIEGGILHLNELLARVNDDFAKRKCQFRLVVGKQDARPRRAQGSRTHVIFRDIEFVLTDKSGYAIDTIRVNGASLG